MQSRHSKLYCLCNRDIQNFIVCAVETFETLLFLQSGHSKLYCLCNREIQNFIVCAIEKFKTLLFVQSRHSKLLFVQLRDSKLCLRVPSGAPYRTEHVHPDNEHLEDRFEHLCYRGDSIKGHISLNGMRRANNRLLAFLLVDLNVP